MSVRTLPIALPFQGNSLHYGTKFRRQVIQVASVASSHLGQILFDILSDADRLARWPPAAGAPADVPNFEALDLPDPLDPANAALTAQAIAHHTAQVKAFHCLTVERGNFFSWLVNAIPEHVRDRIPDFDRMTTRAILAALDAKYGSIDAQDLRSIRAQLATPFTMDTAMDDHIAQLNRNFAILAGQNMAMPAHVKYTTLLTSVQDCEPYHQCLDLFETRHPRVVDQTYDALCDALTQFRIRPARASTLAAAQQDHSLLQQLLSKVAELQAQVNSAKPAGAAAAKRPAPSHPTKYCFTHGLGFHTGINCKNPAHNHIPTATADNKMGGSDHIAAAPARVARKNN